MGLDRSAEQEDSPECLNVSEKQQRCHGRCEEVCACALERMQLDRGVRSETFGVSEDRELGGD